MSAFSDRMAATALRLLTQYGEAVSFSRVSEGAYNASTGSTAAGSTTNFSGYGLPVDYDNAEMAETFIQKGDIKLYVNAVSTVPAPGDAVTVDSVAYRVINVRKYSISSENVLYELQIRF